MWTRIRMESSLPKFWLRHNQYPADQLSKAEFRGDPLPLPDGSTTTLAEISAFGHRAQIESSQVAMQVWCGWLDADVCAGALSRYLTFKNPQQLIIGPFSHGLDFNADPFLTPSQHTPPELTVEQQHQMMADFFDRLLTQRFPARLSSVSTTTRWVRVNGTTPRFGHHRDAGSHPGFTSRRDMFSAQCHRRAFPQPTSIPSASQHQPATTIAG